jgi:hypothetical protein
LERYDEDCSGASLIVNQKLAKRAGAHCDDVCDISVAAVEDQWVSPNAPSRLIARAGAPIGVD